MPTSIALIVAAGRGRRASKSLPKQYARLGSKMMLEITIEKFLSHSKISKVLVVIHPDDIALYEKAVSSFDLLPPVYGGATRQDSVRNGINALACENPDYILIHDAARPFVTSKIIDQIIETLGQETAVIPALPVVDTLKQTNNDHKIIQTISRENLWIAQTPQGFRYSKIKIAHAKHIGRSLTDDAAICEAENIKVAIVEGSAANIKITKPKDLKQANEKMNIIKTPRIGSGFDVHRYISGDFITLCGVKIPHDQGLSGHSDADVALHALTDALLGAIGKGDIGAHFPPNDMKWQGVASRIFVEHALDLIKSFDAIIANVDITLICEKPKIGPHREAMRQSIADILDFDISKVSVKATTTEKLGFTGRGEGIAAQASVLVMM